MAGRVVASFRLDATGQATLAAALAGAGEVTCIDGLAPPARAVALRGADVLLARNPLRELSGDELALLGGAKLIQLMLAGVDFVPIGDLPAGVPVASNAGAYAAPMAEHALAMALAAAKRLLPEHAALARGEFNQGRRNRMLAGLTCGILGFGGIGQATAGLMAAVGMRIHAINRSGRRPVAVDWLGGPGDLDALLAASDVLVVSLPLTRATEKLIGARELALMKPDAILINLARGEIVDEAALFAHLQAAPGFTACIDAWWIEPVRHGRFAMDQPFMTLPNVIGSPHNSASVAESGPLSLRLAGENCRRALLGAPIANLVRPEDRYL